MVNLLFRVWFGDFLHNQYTICFCGQKYMMMVMMTLC